MWRVQEAWTKLVYPFALDIRDDSTFSQLADFIASFQVSIISEPTPVHMWREFQYYDSDLDNMAPYVKRYMRLPQNQRRFVLADSVIQLFSDMLTERMSNADVGFKIAEVDLYLFFNGVGFIVLETQPVVSYETLLQVEWIENLNSDLASLTRKTPIRQRKSQEVSRQNSNIPVWFHEFTADGMLKSLAFGYPVTIQSLIQHVFMACFNTWEGSGEWHPMLDTFLIVYGAVLLKKPDDGEEWNIHTDFMDFATKHITVLRKTLTSNNSNHYVRHILDDWEHNYIPYHNVIHTQSLEGGFVMAFDNGTPHFQGYRSPAMRSFRTNYFYMMLLAMHQRMSILLYAMAAADAALSNNRAQKLRLLREHMYDFTSRCYFSQASVSEERDQLYRRWQRVFNVSQMYEEMKEEIKEIDDYMAGLTKEKELENKENEIRQEAQRTQLFSWISFIFLPVTMVLYIIQASPIVAKWINFKQDPIGSSLLIMIMIAAVVLLAEVLYRTYKRIKSS